MALPAVSFFSFRTYSAPALSGTAGFNFYATFDTTIFWYSYSDDTDLADQIAAYYADLLILQYRQKPKAYAMVEAVIYPALLNMLPLDVQNGFNLTGNSPAVGVQLDVLGKYQGVTRSGYGFNGPVTLDDTDFRTLLQMAAIRNNAGSSLATIQLFLNQFFPGEVYVFDYANMNMSYLMNESIGSQDLLDLFVTEGLLPKPMGVGLSIIAAPVIDHFFALRTYLAPASPITTPLNSYASYQTSWLFLTYQEAIVNP